MKIELTNQGIISIKWIDNWTISLSSPNLILNEELKSNFKWEDSAYKADFSKPKVNGKWQMSYQSVTHTLYSTKKFDSAMYFSAGFAPYLAYQLQDYLSDDQKLILSNSNPFYEPLEIEGLYDFQNEDLNKAFKYKRGLFSTNTSYGKTQTISKFADYLLGRGFRVLIATPGKGPLMEIERRYKKLTGSSVSGFKLGRELNFINLNGFSRRNAFKNEDSKKQIAEYLAGVDVVLLDEAEYCVATGAKEVLHLVTNPKMIYGFSATCDKAKAEPVSAKNGIKGNVTRNAALAGLVGFTLVYRKPGEKYNLHIHKVSSDVFYEPGKEIIEKKFYNTDADGNPVKLDVSYNEQVDIVYGNWKVMKFIERIMRKAGLIFMPINALRIIDNYNKNLFKGEGEEVCIISARGIELFTSDAEGDKSMKHITLDELGEKVKSDPNLKLIMGTKTAFSALDLPGLQNIVLISAKLASVVLQCIGRCARGSDIKVYLPSPTTRKMCSSVYNDCETRRSLIMEYYSESNITEYFEEEKDYEQV